MGVFDKLRDAATMRSYQAAVRKGDREEAEKAAVAAVNRLGAVGLARLDPAKAEGVALKAMERISRLGEEDRAPVHAAVAAEATWELRGLGRRGRFVPSNTEPADEAAFTVLGDWALTEYVAPRSIETAVEKEFESRSYVSGIRDAAFYELSPQEKAQDHAEWLAGEGPSDAALQEWEDRGIAEVTAEMEREAAKTDQRHAATHDLAAFEEDDALQASEGEIQETESSYDFDEVGNEYEVAYGRSDKGFHYSLTGANADDRNWSAPFSSKEEAYAALSKSQDAMYRTGDYESEPDAAQQGSVVSDADAKDVETVGISYGVHVVTGSFDDGFHVGEIKGSSGKETEWGREAYPTREAAVAQGDEDLNQVGFNVSEGSPEDLASDPTAYYPERTRQQVEAFYAATAPRPPTPDFRAALADGEKPEPGMRPR